MFNAGRERAAALLPDAYGCLRTVVRPGVFHLFLRRFRGMARSRVLKPGFFKNEDLAALPFETRLCFAGLWTLADRAGRLEDRPLRIKAELFPYDSVDTNAMLNALHRSGFIIRYQTDTGRFISIPKFPDHQSPHIKETQSTIPAPDKHQTSMVLAPDEPEKDRLVTLTLQSSPRSLVQIQDLNSTQQKGNQSRARANAHQSAAAAMPVHGRSRQPIFRGNRFVVFDWMLEDIAQMLGPETESFRLDEWFDALDQEAAKQNVVLPKSEMWPWLQARLLAEAQARGLTIANGNGAVLTKPTKRATRTAAARALMENLS